MPTKRLKVVLEDLKYANCAACGQVLLGKSERWPRKAGAAPERVHRYVNDRPYCHFCFRGLKASDARKARAV